MRILLTVDPELPVPPGLYGGIERIVDALVNVYIRQRHTVTLCANLASVVPCKLVGWKGSRSQSPVDTFKNMMTLTAVVLAGKFDVVHSFGRLIYMLPLMPFNIPKVMSYQREPSLKQIAKAKKISKKDSLVFTGCSNYISYQIRPLAETYTIYNCVPVERYTFTKEVAQDAPLVFLGRIESIKGTHIAIEVAQKANRRLIIAGNIPEGKKEYFTEKIETNLSDRIVYVGPVNDNQKNEILSKALALLMPVQWNEPFGIVMAEAMACGTPVIGFPFGSIPEVVWDGENGFICKNTEEMVSAVAKVQNLNRNKVREIVENKYSAEKIANEYLDLYKKISTGKTRNSLN